MTVPPRLGPLLLALGLAVAACGGERQEATGQPSSISPQAEAALLGGEIYDIIDRAMSYRTSHRGRSPASLRELGLDELTPDTRRSLGVVAGFPQATVEFRRTAERMVAQCTGNSRILEEGSIAGRYTLNCTYTGGGETVFKVPR